MSSLIPTNQFDGDVVAGRNIAAGGNATIQGTARILHDLIVKGTVDAANIKGANKGLFETAAELRKAYPDPQDGWWALVGEGLPAEIYRAYGGKWIATGQEAGYADISGAISKEAIETLTQYFLSKVSADTAQGLIKLLRGAEFGKFIDSLTAGIGSGAAIKDDGSAQFESIEVRGAATFMETIINRLTAAESDYVFTESGTIESVTAIEKDTYLLTMRKRWDYDFTAFDDYDVCYGSINTLLADGSIRTSWFRVNSVDTSANTLVVTTYANSEVPGGKNYAPVAGMVVTRRGNASNEDRQSCWYLASGTEGCIMYLEGVTKPILDEENYYLFVGKPKHLELFDNLPINYDHPYIFARGAIIQDLLRVQYKGLQVYEIIDMGLWDDQTEYMRGYSEDYGEYIQHQVWYKSCCWRCVADKATVGLAPRWNNTQWICVVGDSNYTLEIESSKGNFLHFGREYTTLTYKLKHGDMDISADAWQVSWTRESDQSEEDIIWNTEHASCNESVDITPSDMPSNWYETRQVTFRVTVKLKLKDGDDEETTLETELKIS